MAVAGLHCGVMKTKKLLDEARKLAAPFCVTNGKKFRLKDFDPARDAGGEVEIACGEIVGGEQRGGERDAGAAVCAGPMVAAADFSGDGRGGKRWGDQACDVGSESAGLRGVFVQGADEEELDHDFLWRCHKVVPERGKIGIFNRSYYEEVLVVRVHPASAGGAEVPEKLITKHIWDERYEDIKAFERYLTRNGVMIRKFFLHISKEEQKKRFLARLDDSKKNWKFSMADIKERGFWKDYKEAYEEMVQRTATEHAPWYVVPADNKWFARLIVAAAIVEALSELDLKWPDVDKRKKKELEGIREALEEEKK